MKLLAIRTSNLASRHTSESINHTLTR